MRHNASIDISHFAYHIYVHNGDAFMKTVSVREMRDHIGSVLGEAEQGETVVIKRHGREIAKLSPMDSRETGLPSMKALRSRIERKGKSLSQDVAGARDQERY